MDVVEDLGWEEFLSVRSAIFAMEPEEGEGYGCVSEVMFCYVMLWCGVYV